MKNMSKDKIKTVQYNSRLDELIGETNPEMIYMDHNEYKNPYFDFSLPLRPQNSIKNGETIRIEVMSGSNKRSSYIFLEFGIRRGVWNKSKGSDILVTRDYKRGVIHFGQIKNINGFIQETMPDYIRTRSYWPRSRLLNKNNIKMGIPLDRLKENGLLIGISDEDISKLTGLIRYLYLRDIV